MERRSQTQVPQGRELRTHNRSQFAIETRADGKKYLSGYGIVYNQLSRYMWGFYERIMPGALEGCDISEVLCKFNHDVNQLLGANYSKTLTWEEDEIGVKYTVELPDTELGRSIEVHVNRGDLRDSSFEFELRYNGTDITWLTEEKDGIEYEVRQINKLKKLWDLSPVTIGAYKGTGEEGLQIAKREYDERINAREQRQKDESESQETQQVEEKPFVLSTKDWLLLNGFN
ncbi:hypothetical protein BWI93_19145 [Siphonobacter sp. BAB-5385]|uniref:HK97 family phage prohead protease n=1 Tax=Siphonobacter sp. BAB-5385 TaxID=1864822 RepID=UPI000B9E3F80|nr:HK97 family phage prohead protease [Siphonobacter sp. BAB-5385]OZI06597.1 hypothetical protein BWI93_19145 [Siphonobacter sp. BAB-5385]